MKESQIQSDCITTLMRNPKVAWAMVITTGKVQIKGYWTTIGKYIHKGETKDGCSDIIGQLADGRFFSIEVKRPGEKPTTVQLEFIDLVKQNGGVSGWTDSAPGAWQIVEEAFK